MFDVNYFMYGYLSGMVGIVASHPFDTVKTAIQSSRPIPNTLRSLYKGIFPPLFGVGLEKAVVFGTFQNTIPYTKSDALSGALSGLTASVVVTPFERMKIMYQTNQRVNVLSLFQGLHATWSREVPGFAIYFSIYNHLKRNTKDVTYLHSFAYGMCSGIGAWTFIYPQDRIKTLIQASDKKMSFRDGLTALRREGLRNMYRGFSYALMRAIPLHATTFTTMEYFTGFSQKSAF